MVTGKTPMVLEYAPSSSGSTINSRGPAGLTDALIMTNHFGVSGSGGSGTRYQTLSSNLQNYKNSNTKIGFNEARTMMANVAQTGTYLTRYSGVIWPKQRRMMVAKSSGSQPATSRTYTEIKWDDIFSLGLGTGKPGDADGDDRVDGVDYSIWHNNYTKQVTNGPRGGDFDNSGIVNGVDYSIWHNNYSK